MEHAEKMLCYMINFCFESSRTRQRAQSRMRQLLFLMCSLIPLLLVMFHGLYSKDHENTTRRLLLFLLDWKWPFKTSYSEYVFLGNEAGIMQSMSRGNHMISSAIWDKSARVNLEHAEIYAYVFLGLKLLVWFEIRPKLPFEIAKFSHSNTVFFICKIFYLSSIQLVCKKLIKLSLIFLQFDRFLKTSVEVWLVVVT